MQITQCANRKISGDYRGKNFEGRSYVELLPYCKRSQALKSTEMQRVSVGPGGKHWKIRDMTNFDRNFSMPFVIIFGIEASMHSSSL